MTRAAQTAQVEAPAVGRRRPAGRARRALRLVGKVVKWGVIVVVLLVLFAAVGGYLYLRRSLPEVDGVVKVAGLSAPVEIIRDVNAVPHIYAANKADAYWGLGYVHAQDRLWQMEFQRRVARGRLSEVFGPATISSDRFLRTLGIYRAAQSAWERMPGDTRGLVEAYVAGVNAYIASHGGSYRQPELVLTGVTPEPWQGPDVLAWVKVVAFNLDSVSYTNELLRRDIVARVGEERARQLMPGYPPDGPVIEGTARGGGGVGEGDERLAAAFAGLSELTGYSAVNGGGLGSNSWVVGGAKSTTGMPVLANDPHLGASVPSIWYLAHLSAGDFDVIGATIPGLPAVIIGRNRSVAWGMTHLVADTQDLVRERLDGSGSAYEFRGHAEPLQTVTETIKVKGRPDVQQVVRLTRHGPLISDAINTNDAALPADMRTAPAPLEPLAFRWPALDPDDGTLDAFLRAGDAHDAAEFERALGSYVAPAMNFVYADTRGNIGYHAAGRLPVRGDDPAPAEGWTGAGEWDGYIAFDELPRVSNPPDQIIVTANNRPVGDGYKHPLGNQWFPAYRARRIRDLLEAKGKVSPEDSAAMQGDTVSLQARELLPQLLALVTPRDDDERRAVELLKGWDDDARADSAAAAIYEAWSLQLPGALVADDLDAPLAARYQERFEYLSRFLANTFRQRDDPWCDDVRTPARETCGDVADRTLREALKDLKARLGADMSSWRWGQLHEAVFAHVPFHNVGPLRRFFSRSVPNGGDRSTVNVATFGSEPSFEQRVAPGYRQVIDLSSPEGGRFIQAVGQSGHFLSRNYDDYLLEWQAVRLLPMRMSRDAVERDKRATLRLEPSR